MVNDSEKENNMAQNLIAKSAKKSAHTKELLQVLTALCALLALILATYVLVVNHYEHKASEDLSLQIEKFEKKQDKELEKEQSLIAAQSALSTKLKQLEERLQTNSQTTNLSANWPLLKASYLLELAQLNAYWSNDYKSSLALLEEADKLLNPFNEPKLLYIRQVLAKEIAKLKTLTTIDISALLSQIQILHESIDKLNFLPPPIEEQAEPKNKVETNSNLPKPLENSLKSIGKLFIIKQHEELVKPLLSPQLAALLKESLHLDLQQAQWAILNQEAKVFDLSLTQALSTLKRAFNDQDPKVLTLIKQLQSLKASPITAEKPTIGQALPLLKQWISTKESGKKQP